MQPAEINFRNIIEFAPYPVFICIGSNFVVGFANPAARQIWGNSPNYINKPLNLIAPEFAAPALINCLKAIYNGTETEATCKSRIDNLHNGVANTFYYSFTCKPLYNNNNEIYGVITFCNDVTLLEQAKQTVEESGLMLNNLIRQAPVGICIIRASDLMIEVLNDAYLELTGKKRQDIEGLTIWQAVPEAAAQYAPVMKEVIETGISYVANEHELQLIRNGVAENVFVDFAYEPIRHFDGTISSVMVIAFDVTDKVLSRRGIEDTEERSRLAIEAADIGTFDLNMLTDETITSPRFDIIFGYNRPINRKMMVSCFHDDDRSIRLAAHEEALLTGRLFYEARIIHPDSSIHWIRSEGKIYYDEKQTPVRMLGTVLDITEFKRLQQQKDDFISVASHELKTPMTSLKASIQILDKLIKTGNNPDKVSTFIEKANTSLVKMQHLIESLLNVSRISAGQLGLQKTTFNLADLVNESCDHIRMTGDQELIISGDTNLNVTADRVKIEQVVVNLLNNAVKYAPNSKQIIIHIDSRGNVARVSVQDFGEGIAYDKIPHLFERYYRVDSTGVQYSGLGLGLYISAEIIERHGGKIGVKSESGAGSTFWFTLPIHN